ncbi:MAG TPA: tRNA (N6-threonylcarbamoyladenosine(37)-N6)-methyltransferase TrmO [Desulfosarcina sp.]|nr:tRNA (N6-threonylcarbamoyladenosine(37)-N6)-methyltransferase TrmO [Desulfosarcina sp.]
MQAGYVFDPIGIIHSCFTEKFGIPRQPGLAPDARASLEIRPPYDRDEAVRGLEAFSHLWIVFVFHAIPRGKWQPTVRPPRLGGNRRLGVFATRSGFRPNPIGISVAALDGIRRRNGRLLLDLSGVDLLDRTPVLDVKPYLPYADALPEAAGGFADRRPAAALALVFSDAANDACRRLEDDYPGFGRLLEQVLGADPRPAYAARQDGRTEFGLRLYDVNVRWTFAGGVIRVNTIERPADASPPDPPPVGG